jgi:hypothetical protein
MAVAFLSYRGVYGFYRVLEPTCHGILESPVGFFKFPRYTFRRNEYVQYHFVTVCPCSFHKQCVLLQVRRIFLYILVEYTVQYVQQYCTLDPVRLES